VKEVKASDAENLRCPVCAKQIVKNKQSGSLTSYLLGAFYCACNNQDTLAKAGAVRSFNRAQNASEIDFCPKCGLQIINDAKAGSLTGLGQKHTICSERKHSETRI
jgi:predicted RNA-binding Zn-ribbon protein involved in translation (DUF1610 family)